MSSTTLTDGDFRHACGLFVTGVAVITAAAEDGSPHGLTINSFSSLSLQPPLVMVAIGRDCSFLKTFETSGFYAVNLLREEQRELSVRFAELPEGRFSGVAWRLGATGSPLIEHALAAIECRTLEILNAGDHRMLIGEVVALETGEGRPLIYFNGGYTVLV